MFTTNSQVKISLNALKQQIKILSDILISILERNYKNLHLVSEKCKLLIFNKINLPRTDFKLKLTILISNYHLM